MKNQFQKNYLKILLLFFTCFIIGNINAQTKCANWEWAISKSGLKNQYQAKYKDNNYRDVTTDASGNTYIAGEFYDSISFGGIKLTSSSAGSSSIYVAKLNNKGQWQWVMKLNNLSSNSIVHVITTDAVGNIYISGKEYNIGNNYIVVKIDSTGKIKWKVSAGESDAGGHAVGRIQDITADVFGNIYITGFFGDGARFGMTDLNGFFSNFLAKINSSGQWKWAKIIGGYAYGNKSITTDISGNIIIMTSEYPVSNANIFVIKIDSIGLNKWITNIGNLYSNRIQKVFYTNQNITVDNFGNTYLTGSFLDTFNISGIKLISSGKKDIFVVRLDSSGQIKWAIKAGGKNNDEGQAIVTNSEGKNYITGYISETVSLGNKIITTSGGTDNFIAELDSSRSWNWAKKAGGNFTSDSMSNINVNLDSKGNIFIAGSFKGTANFNQIKLISSVGQQEVFFAKLQKDLKIKILGDSSVCPTSVKNYKANSDTTVKNIWSITGGTIQSGQGSDSIIVLWNAVGNGTIKLVNTNSAGCKDSSILTIKIDSSACDWVWPGDANHDKIANSQDVLKIGLAYNEIGAARRNASSSWVAQYANDWKNSFQSGVNYKHADCNGDGIVDSTDIQVINTNYGQTWKKKSGSPQQAGPNDAALILEFAKDSFQAGETVNLAVKLGTSAIPAKDIYGLAFSFTFEPALVEDNSVKLNLSNSWLATQSNKLISLTKEFSDNGYADIAISKTDKKNATGSGTIGNISFILKKDLGGQSTLSKVLPIEIQEILAISANEDTIPLNTFGDSIIAYQKTSGMNEQTSTEAKINIYPNPSAGNFILDLQELRAEKIQVLNALGQQVWSKNNVQGKSEIQLDNVCAGLYFINIQTKNGVITKQLIIN